MKNSFLFVALLLLLSSQVLAFDTSERLINEKLEFYYMPSGFFVFDNYIFNPQGDIKGFINEERRAVRL